MALFQQTQSSTEEETQQADLFAIAAIGSVLLSLYEFYVNGNEARGIFIGLWPPTFLAFATYFRQTNVPQRAQS